MAGEVVGWVLDHGPADFSMRAVLVTIANVARRDGTNAHPGMAAMVRGSGRARATVFAALQRLEDEGWIEITESGGGRGNATVYRVVMDRAERAERVQSRPDLFSNGNGPDRAEKRSRSRRETVQIAIGVPLTATEASTEASNAAPAPPTRQMPVARRDPLFDAVAAECGLDPAELTPSARGALNRALAELRSIGADPAEVPHRAAVYRSRFPDATLSPNALAKHWPSCRAAAPPSLPRRASVGDDSLSAGARWLERQAVAR